MRRLIVWLTVGGLTFVAGVSAASLWAAYPFPLAYERRHATPVGEVVARHTVPEGWLRAEERKFSLYLPPDVKEREVSGDVDSSVESWRAYSNKDLFIWYVYAKKMTCAPHLNLNHQLFHVEVSGESAVLFVYRDDEHLMDLCITDVGGGGRGLLLRAGGRDESALNLARRAFDTIEFR